MLKFLIRYLFTSLARIALVIHKPHITTITGSVGKTTTKDMLVSILKEASKEVRGSQKSYNSEFGVPLTILGVSSGLKNPISWIFQFYKSIFNIFFNIPKYLVLEVGLEYPGDIKRIVSWLNSDVAIVTHLANSPVHVENFKSKEDLYEEKLLLLSSIKEGGIALYNSGDNVQHLYTSGKKWIDIQKVINVEKYGVHLDDKGVPLGMDVVLNINNINETFYIPNTVSFGAVYSLNQAIALSMKIDPSVEVSVIRKAIASKDATPGRGKIVPGIKNSVIIDETYNASPVSMKAALEVLRQIDMKKKVVVLGEMSQLGDSSILDHEKIGKIAQEVADIIIVVGDVPYDVGTKMTHEKAIEECKKIASPDTLFMCKGSQSARIEKIVLGLVSEDINSSDHLIRQEAHWVK